MASPWKLHFLCIELSLESNFFSHFPSFSHIFLSSKHLFLLYISLSISPSRSISFSLSATTTILRRLSHRRYCRSSSSFFEFQIGRSITVSVHGGSCLPPLVMVLRRLRLCSSLVRRWLVFLGMVLQIWICFISDGSGFPASLALSDLLCFLQSSQS